MSFLPRYFCSRTIHFGHESPCVEPARASATGDPPAAETAHSEASGAS